MGIEGQLFLSLFQHALGSGKNLAKYSVSNFGRYSSVRMGRVEDYRFAIGFYVVFGICVRCTAVVCSGKMASEVPLFIDVCKDFMH
jgi:hypothetical protein